MIELDYDGDQQPSSWSLNQSGAPPLKLPRLDPALLNNEAIVERFERLEERLRQVERQQLVRQRNDVENGKMAEEPIEVEIDNVKFPLQSAPVEELKKQIDQNRQQIVEEEEPLVSHLIVAFSLCLFVNS
jgi:hypothetical protein